ncbi:MAG: nickel pincer cofactor biosynthesis protein LarC, partial [Thermodesulfobacteriota bacterium]|nr:nickel pincer cofactor biosynthesis protein LarC [Thermodesulfobacteriota bacterium]
MIAYFDIFSGISGDMTLGAFVDIGVPVDWLKEKISSIPLKGFDIRVEDTWQNGIKGVNLFVDVDKNVHARDYLAIKRLISESSLSSRVKDLSLSAFEKIARAESVIHGSDIEKVHFHEVGGVDAIVDIVGSFLCVEYLGITEGYASKVTLGSGSVKCSHGIIPVPVPAAIAILKGVPVKKTGVEMELVTPTGAAIITTLAAGFGEMPDMVIDACGYGSGKRTIDSGLPNLLRIVTGRGDDNHPDNCRVTGKDDFVIKEQVFVVETSIDDMNPEITGFIMEKLFKAKALDVCYIPVQMKKNRPGIRIEVICKKENLQNIIDLILTESTTTGVRYYEQQRVVLKRSEILVKTRFGNLKAKKITSPDGKVDIMPEYEVLREIAEQSNIPLKDV